MFAVESYWLKVESYFGFISSSLLARAYDKFSKNHVTVLCITGLVHGLCGLRAIQENLRERKQDDKNNHR